MKYKLIAVDMDGTLLKPDKTIDKDTISDIKMATENGADVVYCTGRSIDELTMYFDILPMMKYAVCCSGAIIYDCIERKVIHREYIKKPYIEKIVEIADNYRAMSHFLEEKASVVAKKDVVQMEIFGMAEYKPMFMEITRKVDSMAQEAKKYDAMPKIDLYFRSYEERKSAYEELKDLPLTFAYGVNPGIEITAGNVTKATGLLKLLKILRISQNQTIGIGDGDNDKEMLKIVGFPIAMDNAEDEIKMLAKYITSDNSNNGVGRAIRHIMNI